MKRCNTLLIYILNQWSKLKIRRCDADLIVVIQIDIRK